MFKPLKTIILTAAATLVALPIVAAPAPAHAKTVVLLVHGGGWKTGDESQMYSLRDTLLAQGLNARAISYRTNDSGYIPTLVTHVRREVAAEHGRGNRVVLYGISAGGELVLTLAARGEVDGAVVTAPPVDLVHWKPQLDATARLVWNPRLRSNGTVDWSDFGMSSRQARTMSPINRLGRAAAPTLIFHGDADRLVPLSEGIRYARKARRFQKDTKLVTMAGVGHELPVSYWSQAVGWIQNRIK
jgi:acetyl esterase/lipase